MSDTARRFYLTTPIYYVNGAPHIGHAYTSIAADVMARWKRLDGYDVFFLTGTDEHGQKVQAAAAEAGLSPQDFADRVAADFRDMADQLGITYDDFIRTTEERHKRGCQALWQRLADAGEIYLGSYDGWYAVRDEAFYDEEELTTRPDGIRVAPSGAPVEWVREPSWFFRLSAWQDRLLAHYEAHPEFIAPESRRREVTSFVRSGLRDLSISRTSFSWGIPVPGDPGHVMYVWLDALANYITAMGFPDQQAPRWQYWPAQLHLVGKDIIRFHAVYWPAFLMAAGLPVPERVCSNGWWTVEGEKMSKSIGNVVEPRALAREFGLDPLRFFLLRELPFGNDGNFSRKALISRLNVELANDLGNLAQRSLSLIARNCEGKLPGRGKDTEDDSALRLSIAALPQAVAQHIDRQAFGEALEEVWRVIRAGNAYIDHQAPWALRRTDPQRMADVLRVLADLLRMVATVLQPFMPGSMARMLDQLGVPEEARALAGLETALPAGTELPPPVGVFPGSSNKRRKALMLIDSHCHLDYFAGDDLASVLDRAAVAGVAEMVTIGTRLAESATVRRIAEAHGNVWCTVGVHPHNAGDHAVAEPEMIAAEADHPKVVGIGESGLDYFYDKAPREAQQASFRAHIRAARLAGLPLVIHARDADDDIARILVDERDRGGDFDFLLHCFSSGRALAEAAVRLGGYVSFSGILTFPKSQAIREIARDIPADRLLVETDAPYLAPVPHRGKRNEPAWVAHTAGTLAQVRGMQPEALAVLTVANFRRLFQKAA